MERIQYVRYPVGYNKEAIRTLVRRAMKENGFYEGVNLSLAYCDDCGYQELDMEVCPEMRKQESDQDRPHERISVLFQSKR